jgi:hypothetical protein
MQLSSAAAKAKFKEPKARALTLEFKKVNKVYIYARLKSNFARLNKIQLGQK